MKWFRILTNNGWRVFPETIHDPYMKKTSSGRSVPEPVTKSFVDMPGMIMSDRTYQELTIDDLKLTVPTTDFSVLLVLLRNAPVELLAGGVECVKLRGWLEGVVMTPEQRTSLVKQMEETLPSVELAAKREDEEFDRRLTIAQNKSPIKIISHRQERMKAEGDKDVPKPN